MNCDDRKNKLRNRINELKNKIKNSMQIQRTK